MKLLEIIRKIFKFIFKPHQYDTDDYPDDGNDYTDDVDDFDNYSYRG